MLTRRRALLTMTLSLTGCRRRRASPELVVGPRETPTTEGVAFLLVSSLSLAARELVTERLEAIADALEARNNPMALDLEELDIEGAVAEARPQILPMITAATKLAASRFTLDDNRSVHLASVRVDGARSVPAFGASADPEAERIRFAAWPIAHAALLRADDERVAQTLADALREVTATRSSPLALVVDAASLARPPEGVERVARAAGRTVRSLQRSRPEAAAVLSPLAGDVRPPQLGELGLRHDEVLVVPKMGALAERERFLVAIAERIAAAGLGPRSRLENWLSVNRSHLSTDTVVSPQRRGLVPFVVTTTTTRARIVEVERSRLLHFDVPLRADALQRGRTESAGSSVSGSGSAVSPPCE